MVKSEEALHFPLSATLSHKGEKVPSPLVGEG
jgi:hypothetical protein